MPKIRRKKNVFELEDGLTCTTKLEMDLDGLKVFVTPYLIKIILKTFESGRSNEELHQMSYVLYEMMCVKKQLFSEEAIKFDSEAEKTLAQVKMFLSVIAQKLPNFPERKENINQPEKIRKLIRNAVFEQMFPIVKNRWFQQKFEKVNLPPKKWKARKKETAKTDTKKETKNEEKNKEQENINSPVSFDFHIPEANSPMLIPFTPNGSEPTAEKDEDDAPPFPGATEFLSQL